MGRSVRQMGGALDIRVAQVGRWVAHQRYVSLSQGDWWLIRYTGSSVRTMGGSEEGWVDQKRDGWIIKKMQDSEEGCVAHYGDLGFRRGMGGLVVHKLGGFNSEMGGSVAGCLAQQ